MDTAPSKASSRNTGKTLPGELLPYRPHDLTLMAGKGVKTE